MARRAGVELAGRALACHFNVTGKPATRARRPSRSSQVNAKRACIREDESLESPDCFVTGAQSFVQHCQRRCTTSGTVCPAAKDKAVGEAQPRPPQVPSHAPRQHEGQQQVNLRCPRPARVAALAVVEGDVDALIDEVLEGLEAREVERSGVVQTLHLGVVAAHGAMHCLGELEVVGPADNPLPSDRRDAEMIRARCASRPCREATASATVAICHWYSVHKTLGADPGPRGWSSGCGRLMVIAMTDLPLADRMEHLGTESAFVVLAGQSPGVGSDRPQGGPPRDRRADFATPAHIVGAATEALRRRSDPLRAGAGDSPAARSGEHVLEVRAAAEHQPMRVIVTPGAKPIMFFTILALCEAGDEVLVPDPGFPMYESITAFSGAVPISVPLREENQFRMDPDEVERLVTPRTKLLDPQLSPPQSVRRRAPAVPTARRSPRSRCGTTSLC